MSRSPYPHTLEEIAALSLDELNVQIAISLKRYELIGGGAGAKALFKHLVWLEKQREVLHGVLAQPRRFGA